MAGLVPERRSREALERANAELIERHRQHLQSWAADKAANSRSSGGSQQPVTRQPANEPENQ